MSAEAAREWAGRGWAGRGETAPLGPDRAAIAAEALAKARADALARGARPSAATQENFSNQKDSARSHTGGAPPRRQRREDPAPLDAVIGSLVAEVGWEVSLAAGSLFSRWAQIVGADLAAHTAPERLTDGELVVSADSTAWATQLRLLAGNLVRRLNAELGDGTVRRVHVHGPGAPAARRGEWRVRGGRGPRDTYG